MLCQTNSTKIPGVVLLMHYNYLTLLLDEIEVMVSEIIHHDNGPQYRLPSQSSWIRTSGYWRNQSYLDHAFRNVSRNYYLLWRQGFPTHSKLLNAVHSLHDKYVIVPTDKASSNSVLLCKILNIECPTKELGINSKTSNPTYSLTSFETDDICPSFLWY